MSYFEIIIRRHSRVRSRQWFKNKLTKIRKLLFIYLPKKKKPLLKSSLTLLITDNNEIHYLNKKFRKKDKPTDVLSFYLIQKNQLKQRYLGDIVISGQMSKKEANLKAISLNEELVTLMIHAYLHLIGYDHILSKEAKYMFKLQNHILKKIRIA